MGSDSTCGKSSLTPFTRYAAYTLFLVMASQQHDALPAFSWIMEVFVIPLTAVTLLVLAIRARRQHRTQA